ncbi:ABC transporter permease [Staphylococcus chromogenes]|nr:ABC transporter permease [Staphylococcus chromogenes]
MNMLALSWDLQKASVRSRTGTGLVAGLAILSLTVCSWISFIVAGGTWMFYQRSRNLTDLPVAIHESRSPEDMLRFYVILSLIACAFLFPAVFSLTTQAAVMGASGREQRLAALRLVGISSRQITAITAVETALQALIGIVLGGLLSLLTVPLGSKFTFQTRPLSPTDLFLPWWGYPLVAGILLGLAVLSSVAGMQRVRVSPLGVARREIPRALRWWRLLITAVVLVGGYLWLNAHQMKTDTEFLLTLFFVLFIMVSVLNVGAPFILQLWFRLVALLPGTAHFVGTRRIATDARAAWRRCSATAFYGVLVGVLILSPKGDDGLSSVFREEPDVGMMFADLHTGVMITVVIGFVIAAVATLLGQAAEVFERADLSRALNSLGVPRRFHFQVATWQTMAPIVLVSLVGFALGGGLMVAMFGQAGDINVPVRARNAFVFLFAGWMLTALALLAVEPLRNRVLSAGSRRND